MFHIRPESNPESRPTLSPARRTAWPEPTHALKLSWIINPAPLAISRLYRAAYRLAPDVVTRWGERLMNGLIAVARQMGTAKLRLQAISPRLRERLGDLAGSARREGGWGHCHAWFSPDGPGPALWSSTPYDGDYAICLRPLPVRKTPKARR